MKRLAVLFVFFTCILFFSGPGNVSGFSGMANHAEGLIGLKFIQNYDTLTFPGYGTLIIRYVDDEGFVAFNKKNEKLFVIYPFDNGPDYPSEGLFRIVEDDRIGFANLKGEIVIPPRFTAVLPFSDGRAAFCDSCREVQYSEHRAWEGGRWGFIDQKGNEVIRPVYEKIIRDFNEGTAIVMLNGEQVTIDITGNPLKKITMKTQKNIALPGDSLKQFSRTAFREKLTVKNRWISTVPGFGGLHVEALRSEAFFKNKNTPFLICYFIPWQNLTEKTTENLPAVTLSPQFLTATKHALIFISEDSTGLNKEQKETAQRFIQELKSLVNYEENQKPVDEPVNLPDNLQIISAESFKNYVSLEIALPGSLLPEKWSDITMNKMLRITLIPDQGPVTVNWQAPDDSGFNKTEKTIEMENNNLFPDYVPKRTPDIAADYMPALADTLADLPEAKPENLPRLLELFITYSKKAKDNPGKWVEGNMVLGAKPDEYQPTFDELLLSETGDRLQTALHEIPEKKLKSTLKKLNISPHDLEYTRFTFTHTDVMGSGRFFYVEGMEKVKLYEE